MTKVNMNANQYSLLNPGCVVIVSCGDETKDSLFSVTWNMPIRKDPSMVAILAGKGHYSYSFIKKTGEFGINIPASSLVDAVLGCGTTSGHKGVDKWERFGLSRQKAQKIKAPLINETFANLECRISQIVDMGASSLLMAQIVSAQVDDQYFADGKLVFDGNLELLHHLGGDRFCVSNKMIFGKTK